MNSAANSKYRLATPGHRIGATAVDGGLMVVTVGIGWVIWNLITWNNGQTPGKSLLKIRVFNEPTGSPATWGQMCIRQFLIGNAISIPCAIAYAVYMSRNSYNVTWSMGLLFIIICYMLQITILIIDFVWFLSGSHRRIIDYWSGTVVVNEA